MAKNFKALAEKTIMKQSHKTLGLTCALLASLVFAACNNANNKTDNGANANHDTLNESASDAGKDVNVPDNTAIIDTTGDARPDANTTYTTLNNDNTNRDNMDTIGNNRRNP